MQINKILNSLLHKTNKKPKKTVKHNSGKIIFRQSFTQANSFRGFKRFPVTHHGYEPAEQGVEAYRLAGGLHENSTITLVGAQRGEYTFVDVFIDGNLVGDVCPWYLDDEHTDFVNNVLFKKCVDKVYIKVEMQNIVGKGTVEERERFTLFLHKKTT